MNVIYYPDATFSPPLVGVDDACFRLKDNASESELPLLKSSKAALFVDPNEHRLGSKL